MPVESRPHHHQAGDPAPWPDAVQGDVAGHAEQRVGDEEQAGAEAVHGVAEVQVAAHLHLGKADVDAVQMGKQVTHQQQGHQAPSHQTMGAVVLGKLQACSGMGCAHGGVLLL